MTQKQSKEKVDNDNKTQYSDIKTEVHKQRR